MSRLYILGNGFDLEHNWQTSEDKYIDYLEINKKFYENWYKVLLNALKYAYNRKQREQTNLASNIQSSANIKSTIANFKSANFEINGWTSLENNMECDFFPLPNFSNYEQIIIEKQSSIIQWLNSIHKPINTKRIKKFDDNDYFITFNYTKILEDIYGVPSSKVIHVHGIMDDKSSIQFGNDEINVQYLRPDNSSYLIYAKKTNDNKTKIKTFIENIQSLQEIHIFGWNGAINIPSSHGGYESSGSDVTISAWIQSFIQIHQIKTFIYHFHNESDSLSGFKIYRAKNFIHLSYKCFNS